MKTSMGQAGMGPVSVWTPKITWLALPALIGIYRCHGRFNLRYMEANRSALLLVRILLAVRILASPARRVRESHQNTNVDGSEAARSSNFALVNQFTQTLFENNRQHLDGSAYPDSRVRKDRVAANLRKMAASETHGLLEFLEAAGYWDRKDNLSPSRLIILSRSALLAKSVPPNWAGPDVEFACPLTQRNSLFLRLGRSILRCLLDSVRPRKNGADVPPSVGVGIADWGLDPSALLNHLFWWWDSGVPAERVVLFFDYPSQPATQEDVASAEKLGIRCVVLDHRAAGNSPHLQWQGRPGPVASIRRLWRDLIMWQWGVRRNSVGRWAACQMMDLMHNAGPLEDFMLEYNLRGVLHYQDAGTDTFSVACDATGAARIGYHWSHIPHPVAYHERLNQVYFAWGSDHVKGLEGTGSKLDNLMLSGCIVKGAQVGSANGRQIEDHRSQLAARGAERVLVLFDTSGRSEAFYEFFLRKTFEDQRWGLLIKPKYFSSPPWVPNHLPELRQLYDEACATGRVRMLDYKISPAEVAASADFAVGMGINSAITVAALAGHRAIHLDYGRLHDSPLVDWATFYKAGADRLVFDNPDKLWQSLNRFFDEPGSESGLGVLDENLLQEIDPFRDGRAGERIGEYIRWYLEGLDHGMERDAALAQATSRYAAKWGDQMVMSGLVCTPGSEEAIFTSIHQDIE